MMVNRYSTLVHAVEGLKQRGFNDGFKFEEGKLLNLETNKTYQADEVLIVEYHRFEGMSNPGDMSIIYALETEEGRKGIYVSAYGPYADMKMVEFFNKVKIKDRNPI